MKNIIKFWFKMAFYAFVCLAFIYFCVIGGKEMIKSQFAVENETNIENETDNGNKYWLETEQRPKDCNMWSCGWTIPELNITNACFCE